MLLLCHSIIQQPMLLILLDIVRSQLRSVNSFSCKDDDLRNEIGNFLNKVATKTTDLEGALKTAMTGADTKGDAINPKGGKKICGASVLAEWQTCCNNSFEVNTHLLDRRGLQLEARMLTKIQQPGRSKQAHYIKHVNTPEECMKERAAMACRSHIELVNDIYKVLSDPAHIAEVGLDNREHHGYCFLGSCV